MRKNLNTFKNAIKIEDINRISELPEEINKILLLHYTHHLICSLGEEIEIFDMNFNQKEKSLQNKLNSLQKIVDPNFNTIEFLYETKQNINNKNYLLICSDMIHVYYLYDNDKKSILLQSINQFDFQYINQVIEKRNGDLISVSNEYKLSVFNNNLVKNDEIIDYEYVLNKGDNFIKEYREEIYELELDKLNKDNEKIYSVLELFPDKLAYIYEIIDDDYFDDLKTKNNLNNNDSGYSYIKFLDKNYDQIKEFEIDDSEDNYYEMFQFNERVMIFINENYLNLIDLKYFEVVAKIKTNKINFSYSFQKNYDYSKNNFFNYLLLSVKEVESDEETDINSSLNENIKMNINDLTNIIKDGIQNEFILEYKNRKKVDLSSLLNSIKILELSISGDKDNENLYYCSIYCICKDIKENDGLNLIFFKFEVKENE